MKKMLIFMSLVFLFIGCGRKEPVKLDNGSAITINQNLVLKKEGYIPNDPFLQNSNWTYNILMVKNGKELIKDDELVKAFYLAHNADRMIIIGYRPVAVEYKNYFKENGVIAPIEISQVDMIGSSKNRVNVLFFHEVKKP